MPLPTSTIPGAARGARHQGQVGLQPVARLVDVDRRWRAQLELTARARR